MSEGQRVSVEGELFVGRLDEQDYFRGVLRTVLAPQDEDAPPFVFLLHGEGGMGKSQLTRRLRDIALQEAPFESALHALYVDWEVVRNNSPAMRVARHLIRPETVLEALHSAALEQGWGRHFVSYQKTLKQRKEAEKEVAQAVDRLAEEGRYTAIRDLGASGLAKFVRMALPQAGQTGEDLTRNLLAAGIQVGAEGAAQLRGQAEGFLKARLKPELYEVYRQPHEQLARALGEGLGRVSRGKPLLLLLDTYEIVAVADACLRQVIRSAGPRVVWIIAGRDNLAHSHPGDRYYVGYSAEFPRRLIVWDVQELAENYVLDYLQDCVPQRETSREEAAEIHRATLGVPLALRQAADLWARDVPLSAITQGTPDYAPREEIVRLMCQRVLMHVPEDADGETDRRALYLLAMQPRPDAQTQAAVLRPAEGAFDLRQRLAELAGRYSAVRLREGGGSLHDAMGAFVREYLLTTEARHSDATQETAARAVEALHARRAQLDEDLPTLAERAESEDWGRATLDLVHWLFWSKEREAWRELLPRFVDGLGYERELAQSLLDVAETFRLALGGDGRKRLKRLNLSAENREMLLDELGKLAQRGWLDEGGAEQAAERQAVVELWRGRWLVERERYDEALRVYLEVEGRVPAGAVELRKQLGQAFDELSGHFLWPEGPSEAVPSELGLQAAQRAVELDAENKIAWYRLGAALAKLGIPDEAIAAFRRAVELDPQYASPWHGLGSVYSDLGRHEDAIQAYQKAVELYTKFVYSWNGLGNVYFTQGRHDEAIAAFQRALELDPKYAHPWNGLGNVYLDQGRCDEAIAAFQRALELDPKYASPWSGLGNVYHNQDRHKDASLAYQRALELDPKHAAPWNGLGNVYLDQSRYEEAILAYQRSLELDPKHAAPWNGLGNVYYTQGRHEDAVAAYQRALELAPKLADSWHGLGNVHLTQGRYEDASAAFQRALELDSKYTYPWHGLGNVYRDQGRTEEAIASYQRALELDPQDAYPWHGLGNVYRAQGRHKDAIAAYQRALELDPKDADSHTALGSLYELDGQLENALHEHQRAVKLQPDDGMRHASLASVLRKLSREVEAERHLARARKLMQNESEYNKACLEAIAGEADAALEYLARALKQAPGRRNWARQDPDLASLHGDPRFEASVGGDEPVATASPARDVSDQEATVADMIIGYQLELEKARDAGNRQQEAAHLSNLGSACADLGDLRRASEYYEQACTIARELDDRQAQAAPLQNLGLVLLRLAEAEPEQRRSHLSRAAESLEQAVEVLDALGAESLQRARVRYHLGRCYRRLGRWREALVPLEWARKTFAQHKTRPELARVMLEMGQLYHQSQDFESAYMYLKDALRLFRRIDDDDGVAVTQEALGNLALQTARPSDALTLFREARRGYQALERHERVQQVEALLFIARQAGWPQAEKGAIL